MANKKIEVVELNKKDEKIILEEKPSALAIFFKKNGCFIYVAIALLALILLIVGLFTFFKNMKPSVDSSVVKVDVDIEELESSLINIYGDMSLTDGSAEGYFNRTGNFKNSGEVILSRVVTAGGYTIKYYSDGTATKKMKDGFTTRINALEDGSYGINDEGVINPKAETADISIKYAKKYRFGTVIYYSDGSAEITDAKIELYVRNSDDIRENYIADHKVSYQRKSKTVGNSKLYYYDDGTIEIIKNNKSYIVRNEEDIKINDDITFPNNNAATLTKTKKYDDGLTVDYYSDGGAIIKDGTKTISVRKSNSIVIKNNKIYEIVDNIYVEVASKKGNTTYYTNGGATTEYNGNLIYTEENSNIKYDKNNNIKDVKQEYENKINKNTLEGTTITTFEKTAIIETEEWTAIVPKELVLYDSDGTFKEIIASEPKDNTNDFTITNNTNKKVKYRIVIEKSDRTNLNVNYIRYQLSVKDKYIKPTKLNNNIWEDKALASKLSAKGTNYILVESDMEPFEKVDVRFMIWTDYETIPNEMQDKYFYGTIKVYAWTKK